MLITCIFFLLVSNTTSRNVQKHTSEMSQKDNTSIETNVNDNLLTACNTIQSTLEIPYNNKNIFCISFGSPTQQLSMIFTHGAGGDLSSPAVANFAKGFSELKKLFCFQGNMNLRSRTMMFKAVIEHHQWSDVLGGRSLGARAAITTAKEIGNVKALILVSYPLRNQKGEVRDQLLLDINEGTDVLFVIGDRDSMCDLNELRTLTKRMKVNTWTIVVINANHGMIMRPETATEAIGRMTGRVVAAWLQERNTNLTNSKIYWDEEKNEVIVSPWSESV